jgi:Malate:quinone oxidoreductase (Mqo)
MPTFSNSDSPDVLLIGASIMSATLGTFLKELEPSLTVIMFETLDDCARVYALVDALEPLSEEDVDSDLWAFLRWMIQGIGGEWKVEDLDATGRLYQLPFLSGRG